MTILELQPITSEFLRDDAGSPFGIGMPSGSPLRADGQSHYEAWQALLRRDPCSYCAAQGGTVDHVEPRSRAARGLGTPHGWINTVGACARCNGAKRDLELLVFLHRRRWQGAAAPRPAGPAHASRQLARRRPHEVAARELDSRTRGGRQVPAVHPPPLVHPCPLAVQHEALSVDLVSPVGAGP